MATGTPPLEYQWRRNRVDLPGETADCLTVTNIRVSALFSVVVSNSEGAVTSRQATAGVVLPPTISRQPTDQVNDVGGTSTLGATATGLQMSYQWQRNGVDVPGATNNTLTLNNLQASQAGNYRMLVSNLAGSATSEAASLTLFTKITGEPAIDDEGHSMLAAWGDYNNDGYIDLFIARDGGNLTNAAPAPAYLYRNNNGSSFTRMTGPEVGSIATDLAAGWGCAWGDYNNDGQLDICAANWGKTEGTNQNPLANALYRNEGDGTFSRPDNAGPIVTETKFTQNLAWVDYDHDGQLDLFACDARFDYPPGRQRR